MQKNDKVNYQNKLKESVGMEKEVKTATIHYFDDNKIQRWYAFEENATKDILAYGSSPIELAEKIANINIKNIEDFNKVVKYCQSKNLKESAVDDRLFYMDAIYGVKNNTLRAKLTESQIPFAQKSYEEIIKELDAYPTSPAPAPGTQLPGQQPGTPVGGAPVAATQGAPSGDIIGGLSPEMDFEFKLSNIFDKIVQQIKQIHSGCEDQNEKYLMHMACENMYETYPKWRDIMKKRLADAGQLPGQQTGQPVKGPQQP